MSEPLPSNLLSRLRDVGRARGVELYHTLASEAADELERLRALRADELQDMIRLRMALERIAHESVVWGNGEAFQKIARDALAGHETTVVPCTHEKTKYLKTVITCMKCGVELNGKKEANK